MTHEGYQTFIREVGHTECMNIHRVHEYRGFASQIISHVLPNSTTTASVTLAGSVDRDGTCTGVVYHEDGQTWKDVIVQAAVKIKLTDYDATVKIDSDQLVLKEGILCTYSQGFCMDPEVGETYWSLRPDKDCFNYAAIFGGPGKIVTEHTSDNEENRYAVVNEVSKVFALRLLKQDHLCGEPIWITEHPQLFVIEKTPNEVLRIWEGTPTDRDMSLTAYVNTKFLYMEHTMKTTLANFHAHTVHRRCLLHREILLNRLSIAPFAPNIISSLIKQTLGYVGKIAGEVLYILKCVPRSVQLRRVDKCYNELPVTLDNSSFFMSPTTHILQRHAEEVPCSAIVSPLYFLNNQWITLNPHPSPVQTPTKLSVEAEPDFHFKTISNIAAGGLYTQKEINQAQDNILFGLERQALNSLLSKKFSSHASASGHQFSALDLFDKEELEQLAESTVRHLWGWFQFIGIYTSGILGIYFICRVFKFVFEVILNALAIHKTHGCSLHLLASLWDTLTLFLLHRVETPTPIDLRITVDSDGNNRTIEGVPTSTPYNDLSQQAHSIPTPFLSRKWL